MLGVKSSYSTALRLPALLLLLLPLAFHAFLGSFSRFSADSYCHAGLVRRLGWLGMVKDLYSTWSGRFSASLLDGFLEGLAGPRL